MMFGDEMAYLCVPSLVELMALRTKCGQWLKHIQLEIDERRQEQEDIMDKQEAERAAEAAVHKALRAESERQYDPISPADDRDWSADPAAHPKPDASPEPKTEDNRNVQEPPLQDNPDIQHGRRSCSKSRQGGRTE